MSLKTEVSRFDISTRPQPGTANKKSHAFLKCIYTSTVILKQVCRKSGFYEQTLYAEDYAFFYQLIEITGSHILDELLVVCEINDGDFLKNSRNNWLAGAGSSYNMEQILF